MKTIIAVPDFTREAHLKKILPGLLSKLTPSPYPLPTGERAMVRGDIEILIATGLHRPPTKKEIKYNLGNIPENIKISSHNYKNVFYAGKSKMGVPIYLDKKLQGAESVITIGVVEPHLYAGYSGGVKVVAIGFAGEKTINFTHHPRFLDSPGTRICSLKNNLFQDFIQEAGALIPVKYSVNIVNDKNGDILKIFKGPALECFRNAVRYSRGICEKKLSRSIDAVICGIPREKGVNLYQASRIFNYVANTRKPVINKNSIILVKAGLEEGFGKGLGEKRFMKKMLGMKNPGKTISDIKSSGCLAGEHRAYMVAKALTMARLGFISERTPLYKNKGLPFLFFEGLDEAKKYIKANFKKPKIYYLKNAFTTILTKTK
ncbi:MAG: lactate racemase domain-containing protein [Candidatus Omnitrophota bacterium]|nr:lactate racemase domain-containing protein [Candidatus Omnitrophota bacterium]